MQWLKWIVVVFALIQGGWLAFDGGRALVVGDYVTPKSGPRAGQLGFWARVVAAVGFEPRSRFIKGLHLVGPGVAGRAVALPGAAGGRLVGHSFLCDDEPLVSAVGHCVEHRSNRPAPDANPAGTAVRDKMKVLLGLAGWLALCFGAATVGARWPG